MLCFVPDIQSFLCIIHRMKNEEPRIGIDIGRVIIAPTETGKMDASFFDGNLDRAMQTPPNPGAFEGVKTLVDKFEGQA